MPDFLPPHRRDRNHRRADKAIAAVLAYKKARGDGPKPDAELDGGAWKALRDYHDSLAVTGQDMIGDLMHAFDRAGLSFLDAFDAARENYKAECDPNDEDENMEQPEDKPHEERWRADRDAWKARAETAERALSELSEILRTRSNLAAIRTVLDISAALSAYQSAAGGKGEK